MKKSDRIEAFVATLENSPGGEGTDPRYTGWFTCFNAGDYYEAHDVLEHLWLRTPGENHAFFKGLIQLAGAFVHLRKQHEHPTHAKHGARLRPAARLFRLAQKNLAPFAPRHLHLDIAAACQLCEDYAEKIEAAHFKTNPWSPDARPRLALSA